MIRRLSLLLGSLALVAALGIFIPAAFADCSPAGTGGNDTITCAGDDADGINTGAGSDSVSIVSGTVLDTIIAEGNQISVVVNGGALDTTLAETDAIAMPYGGAVIFRGMLKSGWDGIIVDGDGSVDSVGNIEARWGTAISLYGNGSVVSMGDLVAGYNGIFVEGNGSINSTGNVTVDSTGLSYGCYSYLSNIGLALVGSGTITNNGDITVTYDEIDTGSSLPIASGILLANGGTINNTGDITVHYTGDSSAFFGLSPSAGIILAGGGTINNTGDIRADLVGIVGIDLEGISGLLSVIFGGGSLPPSEPTDFTINNNGDIYSLLGMIVLTDGNVIITNRGDISGSGMLGGGMLSFLDFDLGAAYVVFTPASATITNVGDINNALAGYVVFSSNSTITNIGDIDAALLGMVVIGNATITQSGNITVDGSLINEAGFVAYCVATMSLSEEDCQEYYDTSIGMVDSYISEFTAGIAGIYGEQHVDVSGSIDAPIAVALLDGNDSLTIRPFTVINGAILMGDGDDVVQIGNYSQISDVILGGEGDEVNGDLLIIGGGQVCAEDPNGVADFASSVAGLNPDSDTVTYLGQTYTWAEFEALGRGGFIAPCVGKIDDGRINAYDLGAPEALYCTVDNGVSVWDIDLEGNGTFTFAVTKAEIEAAFAVATSSGVNTLVGSDSLGNQLYAISDGTTLTFVSPELREPGKQYMYTFDRTTCD